MTDGVRKVFPPFCSYIYDVYYFRTALRTVASAIFLFNNKASEEDFAVEGVGVWAGGLVGGS